MIRRGQHKGQKVLKFFNLTSEQQINAIYLYNLHKYFIQWATKKKGGEIKVGIPLNNPCSPHCSLIKTKIIVFKT